VKLDLRRLAPTLIAAAFALVYVLVSPPSFDLPAHLLRAKLFSAEGFGIWNNWWYAGHHIPSYSVLFPPVAAALSPQLAGGLAATGTAAIFEALVRERLGPEAWFGAAWFGAATALNLFTGRLAFAFGLLPAMAAILALSRGRVWLACGLSLISALCSPVAALFAALAGVAYAVGTLIARRRAERDAARRSNPSELPAQRATPVPIAGIALAVAGLAPVAALAIAFPEGGTEPFTFSTLWPIPLIAFIALWWLPADAWPLRAGLVLYALACIGAYAIPSPVGSNAARLGPLLAGPLAAILWWQRHKLLLLAAAAPLLYIQWQPPVRDVTRSTGDPSAAAGYYQPLLAFLGRQPGPPFRIEIPFTGFHWEAYAVAPRFPLARGWERQLDIKDNHIFYGGRLTATAYRAWLQEYAIRFVAVSDDVDLDYSAHAETALVRRGLPYLVPVFDSPHWRVFAVRDATPIVSGAATLTALGPDSLTLDFSHAGTAYIRVHFTPYWALSGGPGCVAPSGDFTTITMRRPGVVRLVTSFAVGRIGARSPRCS
jgi:hypothetical protein